MGKTKHNALTVYGGSLGLLEKMCKKEGNGQEFANNLMVII
jgi:hypothetical protein